jgi:Tol biopolymer transport system component
MLEGERMYRELMTKTRPLIPDCFSPSWSPDGQHIAFVRDAEALRLSELTRGRGKIGTRGYYRGEEIWVMNADGTQPRRLARGAGWPSWSRDSKHVYYHSRVETALCSISIEGQNTEARQIMVSANSYPSLSPDGAFVAYEPLIEAASGPSVTGGTVLKVLNLASQSCVAEWVAPIVMGAALWSPHGGELSLGGVNWDIGGTDWWVYDVDAKEAAKMFSGRIVWAAKSPDRTQLLIRLRGMARSPLGSRASRTCTNGPGPAS